MHKPWAINSKNQVTHLWIQNVCRKNYRSILGRVAWCSNYWLGMTHKRARGSGALSKMASAAPESLTIQKQITESLWTSQFSAKKLVTNLDLVTRPPPVLWNCAPCPQWQSSQLTCPCKAAHSFCSPTTVTQTQGWGNGSLDIPNVTPQIKSTYWKPSNFWSTLQNVKKCIGGCICWKNNNLNMAQHFKMWRIIPFWYTLEQNNIHKIFLFRADVLDIMLNFGLFLFRQAHEKAL